MLLPRLVSRTGVMRLEAQLHFPVLLSHKRRVFEPHMGLLWVLKRSGPLGSVDEAKKQRSKEEYLVSTLYYVDSYSYVTFERLVSPFSPRTLWFVVIYLFNTKEDAL
jgi:hypothetical protein